MKSAMLWLLWKTVVPQRLKGALPLAMMGVGPWLKWIQDGFPTLQIVRAVPHALY